MVLYISFVALLFLRFSIDCDGAKFSSRAVARERLIQDLFANYDSTVRPTGDGVRTDLEISLKLNHFNFDEKDGTFKFSAELKVVWVDPKIEWVPKDYNHLELIRVKNTIWTPDLELYNNMASEYLIMHTRGYTWIHSTGLVTWKDQIHMQVSCPLDMRYWPNDRHKCTLTLGSWTQNGLDLDLDVADPDNPIDFGESINNLEYQITHYSAKRNETIYACCPEPYVTLIYEIEFKRRSSAFAVIFHIPAICVAILTLGVFLLEPCRSEKIIINGLSLLMIAANLTYFAKNIASFSNSIPKIVIYYSICFVMVTFSMIISCLSLAATRSKYKGRLPSGLVKILKSPVGDLFSPNQAAATKCTVQGEEMSQQFEDIKLQENRQIGANPVQPPDDWTCIAVVVERCVFIVYGIAFLLLTFYALM